MGLAQPPTSSSWKLHIFEHPGLSSTHCFAFSLKLVCTLGVVEIEHVWTQFISINILQRERNIKSNCASIHIRVSKNGRIYDHRPRIISRIMPRIIPTNHTLVLKPCFQASGESYPESHLRNIPRIIPPNPYLPFNTLS